MRISKIASVFDSYYDNLTCVRLFAWGQVMTGAKEGLLFLIVQESDNPEHTLYEYEDRNEYLEDVERVRRFSGGDDTGVPAFVGPHPPTRSDLDAKPIPRAGDEPSAD